MFLSLWVLSTTHAGFDYRNMLMLSFLHLFRSHRSEFRFKLLILIRTECTKDIFPYRGIWGAEGSRDVMVLFLVTSHVFDFNMFFFSSPLLQPCIVVHLSPAFFFRSSRHQPDVKVCALPGNTLPKQWHLCVRCYWLLPLHLSLRI